jgi:hypothetical protein
LTRWTVPQVQPVVRPDLQMYAPTVAVIVPRTGIALPSQVETCGFSASAELLTLMSPESNPLPNWNEL